MSSTVLVAIAAFVVVDIVVLLVVVRPILERSASGTSPLGRIRGALGLAKEIQVEVRDYLRANWSGDPATLPSVMEPLLSKVQTDLAGRGMPVEREYLKPVMLQIVMSEYPGHARQIREAMSQVA